MPPATLPARVCNAARVPCGPGPQRTALPDTVCGAVCATRALWVNPAGTRRMIQGLAAMGRIGIGQSRARDRRRGNISLPWVRQLRRDAARPLPMSARDLPRWPGTERIFQRYRRRRRSGPCVLWPNRQQHIILLARVHTAALGAARDGRHGNPSARTGPRRSPAGILQGRRPGVRVG